MVPVSISALNAQPLAEARYLYGWLDGKQVGCS
jgi:hypothetical protein